jgi:hypothetical protein
MGILGGENMSFEGDLMMGPWLALRHGHERATFSAMLGVFGRSDRSDDGD